MKAELPKREPGILDWWDRIDVYGRIREARSGRPPFVLHDGPPYANASIHLGQALNKVLKDFVVKSRSMMGYAAPYVPGWDCHGLPIEHRVDKDLGAKKSGMGALEIRARCREHAERFIDVQRREFRRLGVIWDRALDAREEAGGLPSRRAIYRTLDRTYEAEIVRQIGRFFEKDGVYYGEKPVHWCFSCKTALAEAEVEYEDRADPSVYVRFPVRGLDRRLPALAGRKAAVPIWTTTPWTLPANLAVALHPDLLYVAVDAPDGWTYLVAEGLLSAVASKLGWPAEAAIVARATGREIVGEGEGWIGASAPVERPYRSETGPAAGDGVLILGDHVTLDAGTGAVHTAPGHGAEDFHVGRLYGLPPFNPVADDGTFLPDRIGEEWLRGMHVLEANAAIVRDLERRGLLLLHEPFPHTYPHCWRCRNPVLFRATPQWFIAMDRGDLRRTAVAEIHAASWLPAFGEARIAQMVESRPDWCISRQRTWGVPIPAVVCGRCLSDHPDAFVRDPEFFGHLRRLFLEEGSDAWFGLPEGGRHVPYPTAEARIARLVPGGVACPRCGKRDRLEIHDHIVDVWFESGVSHSAVLGGDVSLPWPADLYLEGHDQYRGWFHSSLLVATNDRSRAPYRAVVTHGFTLDGDGRKMSKSLGNVISPLDVCERRGAEILRLWVSMIDFLEDMRLSDEILDRNAEAYRKIRNTFRFLLGNLHGFRPSDDLVPFEEMEEFDRWAMHQLEGLRGRIVDAYGAHQYHLVYHALNQFCTVTLSSLYLDILKDRLYTASKRSRARRSAQSVLWHLARDVSRLMAPVLCFTSEEVWQELEAVEGRERWAERSVHAETFPEARALPKDAEILDRWARLIPVREEVYKALEAARAARKIGSGLEAEVVLEAPEELETFLRSFGDGLRFVFITSAVRFGKTDPADRWSSQSLPGLSVEVRSAPGRKCERCWHRTEDVGSHPAWPDVCARCAEALEA